MKAFNNFLDFILFLIGYIIIFFLFFGFVSNVFGYNADFVRQHAKNNIINEEIFVSMAFVESSFKPFVIGDGGKSFGLMQISLNAAKQVGFYGSQDDLISNPKLNVQLAVKYLIWLLNQTGDLYIALDAFNRGIGNVQKFPYKGDYRLHRYVGKVIENL